MHFTISTLHWVTAMLAGIATATNYKVEGCSCANETKIGYFQGYNLTLDSGRSYTALRRKYNTRDDDEYGRWGDKCSDLNDPNTCVGVPSVLHYEFMWPSYGHII